MVFFSKFCFKFLMRVPLQMDVRYDVVELWAKHLSAALLFFEPLELRALLRAVFNPVILESEGSAKRWEHEGNAILQESNCFEEKSLTSAYPRIPLSRLLNRLKTVLRWIQVCETLFLNCSPLTSVHPPRIL